MKEIHLKGGLISQVDDGDFDLVSRRSWNARIWDGLTHARTTVTRKGVSKTVFMHNMIMGGDGIIDHRDGNGLNNQRHNLRRVTNAQNLQNSQKRRDGSSRFKGVNRIGQRRHTWRARIVVSGRSVHLGNFANEAEAAVAYDAAARKHFGEFACVNFPLPGERCALDGRRDWQAVPRERPTMRSAVPRAPRNGPSGPRKCKLCGRTCHSHITCENLSFDD